MPTTDNDIPLYSIGTTSRMLGVSVQTLRLYERAGLLLVHKSPGGQRCYSQLDIERLECIRNAITEEKISIAGIRTMHSLIPCWQIVHCPVEKRTGCPAFGGHDAGCWTYKHSNNVCAERECRQCEVYRLSTTCAGIKQMIQHSTESCAASEDHAA